MGTGHAVLGGMVGSLATRASSWDANVRLLVYTHARIVPIFFERLAWLAL